MKFRIFNSKDGWYFTNKTCPKLLSTGEIDFKYGFYDEFIVQMATGLIDKFGRDIYEGDILRYKERMAELGDSQDLIAEVVYDKDFAAFTLVRKGAIFNYFTDLTIGDFEIIGNCCENPNWTEIRP